MQTRTFEQDYKLGKEQEDVILPKVNDFFEDEVKQTTNIYSKYDYEGKDAIYEIKSRFNSYSKYPTTLIALDKVLNTKMKQIFIFNFTDDIYYIEYDKKLFQRFPLKPFKRNQRQDFNDIEKLYYHIDISYLKKLKIEPDFESLENLESQLSN